MIQSARKIHDFLPEGSAVPLQEAAVAGLEMPEGYYQELQAVYTEKHGVFLNYRDQAGMAYTKQQGCGLCDGGHIGIWLGRRRGIR